MNRFKLLKVGDELHLVRQQQPGVNDILKPDTLNRTNIRLEDDLKDLLGVDDAQIEGVSKDIQLVSIVNDLSEMAFYQGSYSFNYSVDTPILEVDVIGGSNPLIENPKRWIVFDSMQAVLTNNRGATIANNFDIAFDFEGVELTAYSNGDGVGAGSTEYHQFVRAGGNLIRFRIPDVIGTIGAGTNGEAIVYFDTEIFKNVRMKVGTEPANANTSGAGSFTWRSTDTKPV